MHSELVLFYHIRERGHKSSFFHPKQANKCFNVGHTNAKFTGNPKAVDREIMISNSLEVQSLKSIEDRLLLSHLGIKINTH